MTDLTRLTLEQVHALAFRVLRAQSVSEPQARAIAETITAAERDDCKSHGLFRLPGYVSSVRSGKVTADAVPQVHELAPAVVQVDGQNGFAPLALQIGSVPLVEKARRHGIAALAVTRIYHFAALWPEVEALAAQGLVAFAFTAAMSYVAPAGGSKPLYGTNPMAFAWPRTGHSPWSSIRRRAPVHEGKSSCICAMAAPFRRAGPSMPRGIPPPIQPQRWLAPNCHLVAIKGPPSR